MNSKLLLLFFLSSLLSSNISAQIASGFLEFAEPSEVGFLGERLARVDEHISKFIDEGHLPGGVFLISQKGKIIYKKSFGERSPGVAYKDDDIFRLASMTKAITTVAIMKLMEDGKILLDDPIHYYFPNFKNAQVAYDYNEVDSTYSLRQAKRPITIRHLLTHTSGITYGVFQGGWVQDMYDENGSNAFGLSHDTLTTTEMVNRLAEVPLIFDPGEQYSYGLNMEILGGIVEKVTGESLQSYVKREILEPLSMNDTDYILEASKHDRLVPVYTLDENQKLIISPDPFLDYPTSLGRNHFAGGGGMSGTADDYMKFTLALLGDGSWKGVQILSRNSMEMLTSDQLILQNREGKGFSRTPGITYGLGFMLKTEEGRGASIKSPGTFEWGGYFNTKFFIDPEEELTFVGMTQIVPFARNDFWEKLYNIIYSSLK